MDIELLDDGVHLLALVGALGEINVPFADLTVEEERRVGVAPSVVGGVQRSEPDLRLRDNHVARLDLILKEVIELARVEYCDCGRQLAIGDEVDAVRYRVNAVRAVADRDVAGIGRAVAAI